MASYDGPEDDSSRRDSMSPPSFSSPMLVLIPKMPSRDGITDMPAALQAKRPLYIN